MRTRLNDFAVKNLSTDLAQLDVWCTMLPTFGVRITKGGTRTFILKMNNKRFSLGRYPYVSLKQARDEARRRIGLKYLPATAHPARILIEEYIQARTPSLRPSSLDHMRSRLKYFPDIPVNQVTSRTLAAAIQTFSPTTQNITYGAFKTFLNWCVENEYLAHNPLQNTRAPTKKNSRDRLLTDFEIGFIWKESYSHNSFGCILRTLVLTGQRLNQIASLQSTWTDHADACICFPAYIMKNNTEHTIPLTPRAREHLPVLDKPFRSYSLAMRKIRAALPHVPHWTVHDFRRYFSSTMAKLGTPLDITEALLAHTSGSRNQIQRTYDRYNRLEPMEKALMRYEEHLFQVVADVPLSPIAKPHATP